MMDTENPPIRLRQLLPADKAAIASWPPYPDAFADLDYALRPGGWLDEFGDRPQAWLYAAEQDGELVAFSIIAATEGGDAEFRIALHPEKNGQGVGALVAARTLDEAFARIGLRRLHLIVRQNNPRAIRLYRRLGFAQRGACRQVVNGRLVDFFRMDLPGVRWRPE
ncbi:GNAT family N-acetyltransferase [Dechloromonas sp. XY25]|uniref:GNAT family N-acetyltransferase n=1 Tax=Dechloromonas hankyongensis TaxID=2908002 RepID=A0ABS9JXD1_9RHOO|nr:GNAT family N-acetyltransferase [Dechloromonas hankyongensis]MCG2575560.1 GNAT family N-acetyltransferase [Dechloromonas hankyongensis]